MRYHPAKFTLLTLEIKDSIWWVVSLGRQPLEKISRGPKAKLNRDGNPVKSARAKAWLTVNSPTRFADVNAGPSDPSQCH